MNRHIFSLVTIRKGGYFLLAIFILAFIQNIQASADQMLPATQGLEKKDSKVSSRIMSTIANMKSLGITKENASTLRTSSLSNPLVKVDESGNIQAYIHVQDASKENVSQLQSMGIKVEIVNAKYNIIQAWIPFDKVEEAATLNFVKKITPPSYGRPRTGSVNSEGDAVIQSNLVRSNLGLDGSGVKVGVISDGIDHQAASQATGDLPNNVIVGNPGSGDEGTALLEIIYDIAPGADLAFSTGNTSMEFINSIDFLVNTAQVNVIVDDLGFSDEPNFQDGPIALEAENAINKGVVFVSAAGNEADKHYQALYVQAPSDMQSNGSHFMDFGAAIGTASTTLLPILVGPNQEADIVLQWNDPFGGSSNDYDLYLFDNNGNLLDSSTDRQNGSQDPLEEVTFQNNTSAIVTVFIAINRFNGVPKTLAIFSDNGTEVSPDFDVPSDTVWGHPAAKDVIAVGAVPATSNQFCSSASAPNQIETYSSQGPEAIFFPSFEQRLKPDVVAPDDIHITGAGGFGDPDGRGGFILCGTSGSAPHVAGVAALILSKNPSLTPDQVRNALENTAVDLGSSGADDIFGFGRIDAFAAVQSVSAGSTQPPATQPPSNSGGNSNGGSGGGCALGGEVTQVGLANLLILLIPVMLSLRRLRVFIKSRGR
jgi:subtilisin family serine protease